MKLPKLYAPVKIKFSSLRNGIGCSGGVIYDIDTIVIRKCRRVLCKGGWKWQIVNFNWLSNHDYCVHTDKETLDMDLSELEFEFV